ncbi:MAG: hypothetical protein PUH11_03455 [Bacilli bacterium]|nr:hypothetical protein [Bacilli bacterium]
MSCKSVLYAAMQTPSAVAVGGVIPLGSLIRRYGCDLSLNGNAVNITGGNQSAGYYDVDASLTVAPAAVGTVTVTLFKDGVAVPGATASATAAAVNDALDLNITALVRQVCCAAGSALTLVLTGAAASVDNVALRVQRI